MGKENQQHQQKSMDKGLVLKSIILLTNPRGKKNLIKQWQLKRKYYVRYLNNKLYLKTPPVVVWKASRVQRNTGHSYCCLPLNIIQPHRAGLPSLFYTAPSWMWISQTPIWHVFSRPCYLLGLSICLSEEDTTAQIWQWSLRIHLCH